MHRPIPSVEKYWKGEHQTQRKVMDIWYQIRNDGMMLQEVLL